MGKPSKFSKIAGPQTHIETTVDAATPTLASDALLYLKSGSNKKVVIADLVGQIAGTVTNTGITDTDGVLALDTNGLTGKTLPVAADAVPINDSEATNVPKKATLTNLAKPLAGVMAGTASSTGLTASSGVMTVAAMIAHLVADEKSALFVETGEFDFSGSASAVDTKQLDTMAAKGQLLFALISVSQAANGTSTAVLSICKAASQTTKITDDLTITLADTVYQNKVGNCMVVWPAAGAASILPAGATGDVYFYAAASSGRTAGKVKYALVFLKTA